MLCSWLYCTFLIFEHAPKQNLVIVLHNASKYGKSKTKTFRSKDYNRIPHFWFYVTLEKLVHKTFLRTERTFFCVGLFFLFALLFKWRKFIENSSIDYFLFGTWPISVGVNQNSIESPLVYNKTMPIFILSTPAEHWTQGIDDRN